MIDANGATIQLADHVRWRSGAKWRSGHVVRITSQLLEKYNYTGGPWSKRERRDTITVRLVKDGGLSTFRKTTNLTVLSYVGAGDLHPL